VSKSAKVVLGGIYREIDKLAWAKVLEKLRKRATAASETERRAQFNGFWDKLRSVPSKTLSH
jgi:hypothetical protein